MKKTLIALAALASTAAFAQSSVTISGSVNMGVKNSVAGVKTYGGLKGDRNNLTFAAVEDLGGGMKASAALQMRFDSMNGGATYANTTDASKANSLMEQTKVAVDGAFGQVAVGRFTNQLGAAPIHFMEDSGYGAASSSAYGRLSSQFQYTSPKMAGAQVWLLTADKAGNKYPCCAGNGFAATTLSTDSFSAVGVNYANGPVFAQVASIKGLQGESATKWGATYDLGMAKVSLGQYKQSDDMAAMLAHTSTEMGVQVPYGAWTTALTYQTNNAKLAAADSGKMKKVGYKAYYSLSKRTTLEFEGSNTSNTTAATDGSAYYAGIRHTF